ncbi:MAG TPA: TssQ family T6SS-associated lipoprotein [Burkholderiaceae bacterium]
MTAAADDRQRACRRGEAIAALAVIALLAGCETAPPAPAPTASIAEAYQRPAERALIDGLRLYEDGVFDRAEEAFRSALLTGLQDRHDTAVAFKYLAFIACAFNRPTDCEGSFLGAFRADPDFKLSASEIGHPLWGPVYRHVEEAYRKPAATDSAPDTARSAPR